jgi:hypothetical protein
MRGLRAGLAEARAKCLACGRLSRKRNRVFEGIEEYDTKVTFPPRLVRYEMGKLNRANDKW